MVKKSALIRKTLSQAGKGFLLCMALFLSVIFSSCNNFLEGSDFKEQLDKDIAYANAASLEIRVEADDGTGSITTGTILSKKVTDVFEVEFKMAPGYLFNGWKAYKKSSEGLLSPLSSDYISFFDYNTSSSDGIFRTNVRFLKESEGIVIKPACILLPKIASITPAMESSGCDQDSTIVITFNKAVEPESFEDFSFISISDSDGNSLLENFDQPYFSSDNKSIYIMPLGSADNTKLILSPNGSVNSKNIIVEVSFTGSQKDSDGIELSGSTEHKYKINKNYGNLKEVKLLVHSAANYGSFLSGGEKSCYVGYSIDVQFNVNPAYKFIQLEAVSSADDSVSRADCVSFVTDENDEANGTYKIRLRVTKEMDDILIRPVCLLFPSVLSFSPKSGGEPSFANTPITITFSTPMDIQNVKENLSLVCIPAGVPVNMTEYFYEPELKLADTVLTLTPKLSAIKDFIDSNNLPYAAITVSLGANIKVLCGQTELSFIQNEKSTFTVLYKIETDDIPPSRTSFFVSTDEIDLNNAEFFPGEQKFVSLSKESNVWGATDYQVRKNRTEGKIFIYGNFYDRDSGVNKITVTEKLSYNKNGIQVPANPLLTEYIIGDEDIAAFTDENGNTKFVISYEIKSGDGAVLISLVAEDGGKNPSEAETIYVFNDTEFAVDTLDFYNDSEDVTSFYLDIEECPEIMDEEIINPVAIRKVFREIGDYYDSSMQFYVEYTNKNGAQSRKNFAISEKSSIWYYYDDRFTLENPHEAKIKTLKASLTDLDEESIGGKTIKFVVVDVDGRKSEKEYVIPQKPAVSHCILSSSDEDSDYYEIFLSNKENQSCIQWERTVTGLINRFTSLSQEGSVSVSIKKDISKRSSYCLQYLKVFYGPKAGEFTSLSPSSPLPAFSGVTISYSSGAKNSGETEITLSVPQDSWQKYDKIYYVLKDSAASFFGNNVYFENGKLSSSFSGSTNLIYDIAFYAQKDGKVTEALNLKTEKLTSSEYDNIPPAMLSFDYNTYSTYCALFSNQTEAEKYLKRFDNILLYEVSDVGTGLDYFDVKAASSDKSYRYSYADYVLKDYVVKDHNRYDHDPCDLLLIPVWDMEDDEKYNFDGRRDNDDVYGNYYPKTKSILEIEAHDKAGNNTFYSDVSVTFNFVPKPDIKQKSIVSGKVRSRLEISKVMQNSEVTFDVFEFSDGSWNFINALTGTGSGTTVSCDFDGSKNKIYKIVVEEKIYPSESNSYLIDQRRDDYGFSDPLYICTGESSSGSSGKYDYILPLEDITDSVLVASDAVAFVHTLVTKKSYSECRNWSVEKWEHHRRHIGDAKLDFSTSNVPQKYNIPLTQIENGDCYVVVAHFANGTTAKSRVMVK